MKIIIAIVAGLTLAACGGTVVKDRVVTVNKPVVQPCVSEEGRPAPVITLKEEYPDSVWRQMDVRQKAAAVARKGLERQGYGEKLDAATGACN